MKIKLFLFLMFIFTLFIGCEAEPIGNNIAPELSVDIDNVSFGETLIGERSSPKIITVRNNNSKPIPSIQLVLSDGFVRDVDNTTCTSGPIRFAPYSSCELAVRFLPDRRDNITGILSSRTDNSSKRLAKFIGLGRNSLPLEVDNSSDISYWNIPVGAKKSRYILVRNNVEDGKGGFQDIYLSFKEAISDGAGVVTYELDNSSSTCFNGMILGFGESCVIAVTATANVDATGTHTGSIEVFTDYLSYTYKFTAKTVANNTATVLQYPKSRIYPGIAVVNNKLYLYGGIKDNKTFENSLWVYDLSAPKVGENINGSWRLIDTSATNPPAVINMKPVVVNNKILIVGGRLPNGATNDTAISIDTTSNTVTLNPGGYKATEYGIAKTSTDNIYAFGGYDNTTFPTVYASLLQSLRAINSNTGAMSIIPDNMSDPDNFTTPVGRVGNVLSAVNIGGKEYLYLYGGKLYDNVTTTGATGELWRYTFDNNTWSKLSTTGTTPSPIERVYAQMEYIRGKLFLYGGQKNGTAYYDFYEITPSSTATQNFRSLINLLVNPETGKRLELLYPGVTASGNKLYLYGGIDNATKRPSDKLFIFDVDNNTMTGTTLQIPYQLKDHAIGAYIDNKSIIHIYAIGGSDNMVGYEGKFFFKYNTATGLYQDFSTSNPPISSLTDNATFTQLGKYLFFVNADSAGSGFYRYNPELLEWQSEQSAVNGTDTGLGRHSHSAIHYRHGKAEAIYIFGGVVNNNYSNSTDIITLDSKSNDTVKVITSNSPTKPSPRANHSMVEVNGDIYLYGGNDATQIFSDLWVFEVTSPSTGEGIWSKLGDLPPALKRRNHKLMVNATKDKLYIIGGVSSTGNESGVKAITLSKTTPPTQLPDPVFTGDTLNISGKVHIENVDGTAVSIDGNRISFINF